MPRYIDLTGQKFGMLSVLGFDSRDKGGRYKWRCVCDCGEEKVCEGNNLRSGHTRSCGCLKKENPPRLKHGQASRARGESAEYKAWLSMKQRCTNESGKSYKDYGGRGIKVCVRWLDSFENFVYDMGRKPSAKYSLERVDHNGDYEPSNCRWASKLEQANNTRSNRYINLHGKTKTLSQWIRELKLSRGSVENKIYVKGWTPEQALLDPESRKNI